MQSLHPNDIDLMEFINFKGALTIETVMFYISEFFLLQRRENRVHSRPQKKITEIYLKL